jgi:hypothetical protein
MFRAGGVKRPARPAMSPILARRPTGVQGHGVFSVPRKVVMGMAGDEDRGGPTNSAGSPKR